MQNRFELFTVLISKINRSIRKIKTEEMEEFALTGVHVSCLYYLYKWDGLTAAELSAHCWEDKASISRSLEYLEQAGYVEREKGKKKRYNCNLHLSEAGKVTGARIAQKVDAVLESAGRGINEADREILYRCLGIISDNLTAICNQYGEENGNSNIN